MNPFTRALLWVADAIQDFDRQAPSYSEAAMEEEVLRMRKLLRVVVPDLHDRRFSSVIAENPRGCRHHYVRDNHHMIIVAEVDSAKAAERLALRANFYWHVPAPR